MREVDEEAARPMPSLQVLVATMHQNSLGLARQMNTQSDVLIVNQCNRYDIMTETINGHEVTMLSLNERGVGLSRNTALDRASGDICLFADDDVVYYQRYPEAVLAEFSRLQDADVIVFNLDTDNVSRPLKGIHHRHRVGLSALELVTMPRIAARTESLRVEAVHFSLLFGGGARYGSGEDTLFVASCLRAGLRVYTSPVTLGRISLSQSTWYFGVTRKYLMDKGALFSALTRHFWPVLALRFLWRHRQMISESVPIARAAKSLFVGGVSFRRRGPRAAKRSGLNLR